MTEREALTLVGLLANNSGNVFTLVLTDFNQEGNVDLIIDYFKSLELDFEYVFDILSGFYYYFYHSGIIKRGEPLPEKYEKKDLFASEFDYIEIDHAGRVGIWCEVDGFIAWLDEHGKNWITDTKEEVIQSNKEAKEWFEKEIRPLVLKMKWDGGPLTPEEIAEIEKHN